MKAYLILDGSRLHTLYGETKITERHRHRFEFNNKYRQILTGNGLNISGTSPDGNLVEAIELPGLNFYIGVQFHPEFKSRPNKPHPLFLGLVNAALDTAVRTHGRRRSPHRKMKGQNTSSVSGNIYIMCVIML